MTTEADIDTALADDRLVEKMYAFSMIKLSKVMRELRLTYNQAVRLVEGQDEHNSNRGV